MQRASERARKRREERERQCGYCLQLTALIAPTVIHDGRRHILARYALRPGRLHIQIQSHFAAILSGILEIPLHGKIRIGWLHIDAIRFAQRGSIVQAMYGGYLRAQTALDTPESGLLYGRIDLQYKEDKRKRSVR